MRLGLISDIHGNLLALDAVLAELEREAVDQIVCLGDVAAGPQANDALARIRELACPVIMGNWDAWSLDGMPEASGPIEERLFANGGWWADRLSDDARAFIKTFVPTVEIDLDQDTSLLCFHGSPTSYDHWIVSTTPDDEVEEMLGSFRAPVLAGGHTHLQMLRRYGDAVIVNPGSVGLPFRIWSPEDVVIGDSAEYGILSAEDGRLAFDLRRTPFDVEAYVASVLDSGLPYADWWASSWALPAS